MQERQKIGASPFVSEMKRIEEALVMYDDIGFIAISEKKVRGRTLDKVECRFSLTEGYLYVMHTRIRTKMRSHVSRKAK